MPEKIKNKLFPMSLRPQAHDIINFWLFYTMAKSQLLIGKNPWKDVAISGWALDPKGEKMSKSKGNIIEPQKVAEKYGSDALRYWASSSKLGEDISYQEKDVITGKKLVTKLRNAARFVFMNLEKKPRKLGKLIRTDETFLEILNNAVNLSTNYFENYDYARAKQEIEQFFWKDFADNYLELIKKRIYHGDSQEKESALYSLYTSLLTVLKLFAPIIPYVTEEVYQQYFRKYEKEKSIHISKWPESKKGSDKKSIDLWLVLTGIISRVRQEKSQNQKSMNSEIILYLKSDKLNVEPFLNDLKNITNAKEIREGEFKVEFV
jgi:valyl-tRNA synthetase